MHRSVKSVLVVLASLLVAPAAPWRRRTARPATPPATSSRRATTAGCRSPTNSTDQLPLYDGLTPLRGNVTAAGHRQPLPARELRADRRDARGADRPPGLKLIYDSYGIPHVYGKTRADVAFGAGWATARDRGLLLQLGRGPARVAVADVPGIDAFALVTSAQSFVPEPRDRGARDRRRRTCSSRPTARRAARSSPTHRRTPTASTPTGRRTTSTSRRRPSTT